MQRKILLRGTCCTSIHNVASLPAWTVWSAVWSYGLCTYTGLSSFQFPFFSGYSPNKLVNGSARKRLPCLRLNFPLNYAGLNFWVMQEFQLWRSPQGFLCSFWLSCMYPGLGHTSPMQLEGYVTDADCYLLNVKISDHVTLRGGIQNSIKFCRLPRALRRGYLFNDVSSAKKPWNPQQLLKAYIYIQIFFSPFACSWPFS